MRVGEFSGDIKSKKKNLRCCSQTFCPQNIYGKGLHDEKHIFVSNYLCFQSKDPFPDAITHLKSS